SSRRRHTRSKRDWSSDVCSSDLPLRQIAPIDELHRIARITRRQHFASAIDPHRPIGEAVSFIAWSNNQAWANDERFVQKPLLRRSEERRVGKECRSRW